MKTKKTSVAAIHLRDYQELLIQQIYQAWSEPDKKRVLMQLPTGGGKTICFAQLAADFAAKGEGVIVLTHRKELLEQAACKLEAFTGQEVGRIKAGLAPNYKALIQVASVLSLRTRLSKVGSVGLVICDEAHHSTTKTWQSILAEFPDAYVLGVTATPVRLDGSGFIGQYDVLVQGETVRNLIGSNVLSDYKLYAAPAAMRTEGAKVRGGDYSTSDVSKLNNVIELSGHLINSYKSHADGLQAIVFAVNIEHSKAIAERYKAEGIPAAHLDGTFSDLERASILGAFRRGEIKVLSNCNLFDEGFDLPSLGCVQIARPTKSVGRYLQMAGRGLRWAESKPHAVLIDHTTNYLMHGLPDADRDWSLHGSKAVTERLGRADDGLVVSIDRSCQSPTIVELRHITLVDVKGLTVPPLYEKKVRSLEEALPFNLEEVTAVAAALDACRREEHIRFNYKKIDDALDSELFIKWMANRFSFFPCKKKGWWYHFSDSGDWRYAPESRFVFPAIWSRLKDDGFKLRGNAEAKINRFIKRCRLMLQCESLPSTNYDEYDPSGWRNGGTLFGFGNDATAEFYENFTLQDLGLASTARRRHGGHTLLSDILLASKIRCWKRGRIPFAITAEHPSNFGGLMVDVDPLQKQCKKLGLTIHNYPGASEHTKGWDMIVIRREKV